MSENDEQRAEIAELRKEIAALRKEIAELKAAPREVHHHYGAPAPQPYTPQIMPTVPKPPWRPWCGDAIASVSGRADLQT